MKKIKIFLPGVLVFIAGGLLVSCGNKKAADSTNESEVQNIMDRPIPGINHTEYNAAFFNDESNKGDTASSAKYAETETGLKYVIVKEGEGKSPKPTDNVTVHYVGTLPNGFEFDSSIDRGEPTTFPLNRVIPGWTEGLQLMKEGGVAVFYIPGQLAYANGVPDQETGGYLIPPMSPLLFWVELIEVK
ncbi:MAG: FKBP-type peptidyl-prolyl cis-trans isomerase [Muribaculaceae bacterium]|nr:FKBP-type peptidyl-prolyl cis-trans isomerase [Muribaculaceae bacterium]